MNNLRKRKIYSSKNKCMFMVYGGICYYYIILLPCIRLIFFFCCSSILLDHCLNAKTTDHINFRWSSDRANEAQQCLKPISRFLSLLILSPNKCIAFVSINHMGVHFAIVFCCYIYIGTVCSVYFIYKYIHLRVYV